MKCIMKYQKSQDNLSEVLEFIKTLNKQNTHTSNIINIFLLQAEVGMGKSYLVSQYCKQFDINSNSPTFSFIHEYGNGIYHYDLYLKNNEDSIMKLYESLNKNGIHFVEWASEKLANNLNSMGFNCALLKILPVNDNTKCDNERIYEFFI